MQKITDRVIKMKNNLMITTCIFFVMCLLSLLGVAKASTNQQDQSALQVTQTKWLMALDAKGSPARRFRELQLVAKDMFKLSRAHPKDAELKAWTGVMLSSLAVAKKVGSGEHLAFSAQRMLESAQALHSGILDQSHLANGMSAREALKRALIYNPSGLDVNVYYSAFLNEHNINMLAANTKKPLENVTNSSKSVIQTVN